MNFPVYITDYNCTTPLGFDVKTNWENLINGNSGVIKHFISAQLPEVLTAKINSESLEENYIKEIDYQDFTRLEKMLALALKPLVEKNNISEKSLLILSTTKGNIAEILSKTEIQEQAFLQYSAKKIADYFGFKTKPIVVSNACVSGVLAVSVAKNLLQNHKFENAFIIAGDEATEFVLSGFNSFQALSSEVCKPYDKNRNGINLGEAAAAVFLTKEEPDHQYFEILGESSINDANHISGPSRNGEGLYRSIQNAMKEAQISENQIDYISAHGTATIYNDEMESFAFSRAGMSEIPLNSLKGFYGHCLGASGLLELIIAMESAKKNVLIKSLNFEESGVSNSLNILSKNTDKQTNTILKTASGFGGCNAAIILKKSGNGDS